MRSTVQLMLVLLLLLAVGSYAGSFQTASWDADLGSPIKVFDFIVVGSGAAGSIVAARLANETSKKILLLEAGAKGTGQRDIGGTDYVASDFVKDPVTGEESLGEPWTRYDVPLMADTIRSASNVLKSMWDINSVGPLTAQAKVVGGNQATNGLVYNLPQDYDFDNWNIPGYNSTQMRVYLRRIENASETGYPNRGTSGPINIRIATFETREVERFTNACKLAGYSEGGDFNSGTLTTGIYKGQTNSKNGIRESSAVSYLAKVLGKSNLTFRTSATVTRVLFNALKQAIGVEYYNKQGKLRRALAVKEVILAGGDLQVAKMLFNSGIGPSSILTAFNITPIVVNEIIGQKIRNHQRASMSFSDPSIVNANFYAYPGASLQFARDGTGVFDTSRTFLSAQVDPTSPYPDINIGASVFSGNDVYARRVSVTVSLTYNEYANGTLNLTSSDPLAPSVFTANVFVVDSDVTKVAKGILEARRIMTFWNNSGLGSAVETSPGAAVANVTQLVAWIRANPSTNCHYYSSTPMGLDASAPCDTRFLVRGVTRLRIVGPSVIPGPVFNGMQGLVMALAEKGTDMIKEDHCL